MIEHLTARPLVRQVHVDCTTGCLVVDHDHDSPTELLEEIHDDLRGWELADNGERVMVDLGVHERQRCPRFSGRDSVKRATSDETPLTVGWTERRRPAPMWLPSSSRLPIAGLLCGRGRMRGDVRVGRLVAALGVAGLPAVMFTQAVSVRHETELQPLGRCPLDLTYHVNNHN